MDQDNLENIKISEIKNEIKNDNDTTFNRLKDLQKLLKKESAVKELFIRMKEETKKNIENQCIEVLKKKMEVLDILQKINNEKPKAKKNTNSKESNKPLLKEYILVENNYKYLSDLNRFISNILKYLWEEPKIIANLLIKADKEDVKNHLAHLVCNNFYQNILSPNYIEDPLIYIIYILLKNEINSIENIENIDSFLENTQCSYLLGQLIEQNDVKEFFKIILQNCLEDLDTNRFRFDLNELNELQQEIYSANNTKEKDKNNKNKKQTDKTTADKTQKRRNTEVKRTENNSGSGHFPMASTFTKFEIKKMDEKSKNNNQCKFDRKIFDEKYLKDITIDELKTNIEKQGNDTLIKSYYEYVLLNSNEEKDIYSHGNFNDYLDKIEDNESVLNVYQENFFKVIDFLSKFFENLIKNFRIIPYSVKCVCKIIYDLISKKFPDSTVIQKNLLISKFFYKILIFSIFQKPDINALINNYIISNRILYNLRITSHILWKFVNFQLYKNKEEDINNTKTLKGNFTPFNRFFLEKISLIFEIYKSLIDCKLPKFIKGLIDESIKEDEYYFDFFNENPNEISFYQNILLTIKDFNAIFTTIDKYQKEIIISNNKNEEGSSKYEELKKRSEKNKKNLSLAIQRLKSPENFEAYSKLIEQIEYSVTKTEVKKDGFFSKKKIIEEKKEKVQYFHVSQLLFNENSSKIFSLEQTKVYHHIKEIKEKDRKTDEMIMKNNIIKCKNFISSILYNYRTLEKDDFNENAINNTMNILKELKYFMKSSNYLIDGTIPSDWYLLSLMQYLKKIPEEYKENDYEKLFVELTEELDESIKTCNFEYMSMFLDEMKFGNRNKAYFEKVKQIYMDIELNNKANDFIENDIIDIVLYFDPKKPEFSIFEEGLKEKQLEFLDSFTFENKFKGVLCKTIAHFTNEFPNLNAEVVKDDIDDNIKIFQYQRNLDIPNVMMKFFNIISLRIKKKISNENELNMIKDKIYDYVMNRIYDKIYPPGKNIQDVNIIQKVCSLSWIEPENVIKDNAQYDFDFVLADINNYFKKIRTEKSPRKKIIYLDNIFLAINRLLKFNKGDGAFGVDDQLPLLTYCFIKSRPWKIYTDSNFMRLYIGNKKNKAQDNQLSQLLTICDIVKQARYTSFNNVKEVEYHDKCTVSYNDSTEFLKENLGIDPM